MREYPVTCKKCGTRVDYPSIRCSNCGTRIPCPMGFLSTLLAVLWFAQLPVTFFFAFICTSPEYWFYLVLILLLNVIPITILLLLDRRKSRLDAIVEPDTKGES